LRIIFACPAFPIYYFAIKIRLISGPTPLFENLLSKTG